MSTWKTPFRALRRCVQKRLDHRPDARVEQVHRRTRDGIPLRPWLASYDRPNDGAIAERRGVREDAGPHSPALATGEMEESARGVSAAELDNATRKVGVAVDRAEKQLSRTPWLAGDMCTLADINYFAVCGMIVHRMFADMDLVKRPPRLTEWVQRMHARPGVKAALAMSTHPVPEVGSVRG